MLRRLAAAVALASFGCASSAVRPPASVDTCPDLPAIATSSATPPLEGVTKLELHRRGVRARALAAEAIDLARLRGDERDRARAALQRSNTQLSEERAITAKLEQRPTWWTAVWIGTGGAVVGAIIGALGALRAR